MQPLSQEDQNNGVLGPSDYAERGPYHIHTYAQQINRISVKADLLQRHSPEMQADTSLQAGRFPGNSRTQAGVQASRYRISQELHSHQAGGYRRKLELENKQYVTGIFLNSMELLSSRPSLSWPSSLLLFLPCFQEYREVAKSESTYVQPIQYTKGSALNPFRAAKLICTQQYLLVPTQFFSSLSPFPIVKQTGDSLYQRVQGYK